MGQMALKRKGRNYAGRDPSCADGDEFIGCNLAQAEPGTEICKGKKGLRFAKCNLVRAVVPKDSVITDCNISQVALPAERDPKVERLEAIGAEIANLQDEKQQLEAR